MNSDKVALEGMEFYAYHGFYEEERKIGNRYTIDLEVTTDFSKAAKQDDLSGTIDYVQLYEVVKSEMEKSAKLLEKLGQEIIDRIFIEFSAVSEIKVSVSKHNPPFGGICAKSKVTLERTRS
ncbi:dihydroneopterin aldolase [Roseivirga echinicomitans]